MHTLFKLGHNNANPMYLNQQDLNYHLLQAATFIIVDEFSQVLASHLDSMLSQLNACKGAHRESLLLRSVALVFIGDPRQLPPICRHTRRVRSCWCPGFLSMLSHPPWQLLKSTRSAWAREKGKMGSQCA